MLRSTLYALIGCGLLVAVSCNTPPTSTTAAGTDTGMAAGNDQGDMDAPATPDANRNYTLTTLDTTIKSPRKELKGTVDGVDLTVNYGSPSVNNRTIYGDLVPYGKVWRTGANEATRITFGQDVKVGTEGTMLPAGTYSLFTLPADRDNWTVIFNKTADQWGAYDYADADDAARVTGTASSLDTPAEKMDFALEGNTVSLMWADMKVGFTVAAAAR